MPLDQLVSVDGICMYVCRSQYFCVELSTADAEEVVELKSTVAQLQEQLKAKDKTIQVFISDS